MCNKNWYYWYYDWQRISIHDNKWKWGRGWFETISWLKKSEHEWRSIRKYIQDWNEIVTCLFKTQVVLRFCNMLSFCNCLQTTIKSQCLKRIYRSILLLVMSTTVLVISIGHFHLTMFTTSYIVGATKFETKWEG